MNVRIFRGDEVVEALQPMDRGLQYGDGLFETMRVRHGRIPWWSRHWRRLSAGAKQLGIPVPARARIESELESLCADVDAGIVKLVLTRGVGSRGYASADVGGPSLVMTTHPMPPPYPEQGLNLRWADLKLAVQPALAGLKHLNRLEQVLIRREWSDPMLHEALCCDSEGFVRCALAANVFVRFRDAWVTPSVQKTGVAGITRGWLLESRPDMRVDELRPEALARADAVFLCNAVRGILPVRSLADRIFEDHDAIHELQALWALSST